MTLTVYLDESGDLGWNFNRARKRGGSSRYLTIGYLIIPQSKEHILKKFVSTIYQTFRIRPKKEMKGMSFSAKNKEYVSGEIMKMLQLNPDFIMGAITVDKKMLSSHIKTDGDLLYNYMIRLAVLDQIYKAQQVDLVRDERYVKFKSDNSCIDYLQTTLWFDYQAPVIIKDFPTPSHKHKCIILIDWITHFVWSYYERGEIGPHAILSSKLKCQTLFF